MARVCTPVTVGFDIGGTNLRGAVVDACGTVLDFEQVPTPSSTDALERGIKHIVEKLATRHDIAAVGVAVAAFLDPDCTTVRFAPHLPWRDTPVQQRLQHQLQLPVRLEHDANAAAWGEYRFGAARNANIWALFAIGTGIGGALMIDGKLYRGAFGTAPEFGHLTVVPEGRTCPCGKRGCLERYCSGTALVATAREIIAGGKFDDSRLSIDYHARPEALTGHVVMEAARRGDAAALAAVDDFAHWLGEGLAIVADILDPELIVIGGGVACESVLYLDAARKQYGQRIVGSGHRPLARLRTAELGSDAGMIGVADLARQLT
ncbi:ROK family protein [Corynebacterium sp.]|uniref:ROK family protein n=1 Tax=Corynebacterium sp. TaxID=1720 RepID=UPI0026DBA3F5|nr:ROK family protein [Corynebacterium sp.]MDO5075955.1 ROK family protein [Corynebacterium sp.]